MLKKPLSPEDKKLAVQYDSENLMDTLKLSDEELSEIGNYVVEMFDEDTRSRQEWMDRNDRWIKLASQIIEQKNYPWVGASNVKYPLLSTASLQFHARAYPALIPDSKPVKMRIVGMDTDGEKRQQADRVSDHMSWQVLDESTSWQENTDRMVYVLPISGLAFKKTYYSSLDEQNKSPLILADELVINYHAKDFEKAVKTHIIPTTENDLYELQASGFYADVELKREDATAGQDETRDDVIGITPVNRGTGSDEGFDDTPFQILESHTFYDIDEDGYKEPLIITVDHATRTVLRISRRYNPWDVKMRGNKIIKIHPKEYFTRYAFLPNPESAIYANGFGSLLGPLNAAADTILNQLIDAGHMATLGGGFLGKGIRVRGGRISFQPGEWKVLQSTGADIKSNIFPLPVKEPSNVLYQLLGMVIQSGERLSSVKDIMVGENPGQNQPYATTVAVMEQGMKVFVGIYKRLYRSLTQEYKKMYMLNALYLTDEEYLNVLDDTTGQISVADYDSANANISPNADPSIISEAHKMMKAQSLLQKKAAGLPLNTQEVTLRVLEVEGHEDIQALMKPDPPSEDPKITFQKMELQVTTQLEYDKLRVSMNNSRYEAFKDYSQAMANLSKAALNSATVDQQEFAQIANFATQEYKSITERMSVIHKELQHQRDSALKSQGQEQPQEQGAPQPTE